MEDSKEDKHARASRERQAQVDEIKSSPAGKKIVIGGPGTGKTHLFKSILEGKRNPITLTFVNALVEDLSLELFGLSEVRTLHGFARAAFKEASGRRVRVFPKLSRVIRDDAEILLGKDIDFDELFYNRDDNNEHLKFYKRRKDYYDYYGYADIVFAAVKYFEKKRDKVPTFDQVLVDEFQDFNRLEVSLIDLLAERSPILLAGDDDQALYESLKSASPKYIRHRHRDRTSGYEPFHLSYCSRCTRVIVKASDDIITAAIEDGYLAERLKKPFHYFDHPDKDQECACHPHIIYSQVYPRRIPWFIQDQIGKIAEEERGRFGVLIISPARAQCSSIVTALEGKGFANVQYAEKKAAMELTLLDGLKLLLEDKDSNLGWRLVAQKLYSATKFQALLRKTDKGSEEMAFQDLVGADEKRDVKKMLTTLRGVRDGKKGLQEEQIVEVLSQVGIDALSVATGSLKDELKSRQQHFARAGIRKIPIKAATVHGSKGLDADYVFITHLDDRYFIKATDKSKISDQDICNFVVALTRARKKVFLISSVTTKRPTFLKWIKDKRIQCLGMSDEGD